jgi:hypothetical protein
MQPAVTSTMMAHLVCSTLSSNAIQNYLRQGLTRSLESFGGAAFRWTRMAYGHSVT